MKKIVVLVKTNVVVVVAAAVAGTKSILKNTICKFVGFTVSASGQNCDYFTCFVYSSM